MQRFKLILDEVNFTIFTIGNVRQKLMLLLQQYTPPCFITDTICDQACENRAYVHTKFDHFCEV